MASIQRGAVGPKRHEDLFSVKIVLAGPFATASFRAGMNAAFEGAPTGMNQSQIAPLGMELALRGHQVWAITLDSTISEPVRVTEGAVTLVYLPVRKRARYRAFDLYEKETRLIQAEIAAAAPDIVHAHWTYEYAGDRLVLQELLPNFPDDHCDPGADPCAIAGCRLTADGALGEGAWLLWTRHSGSELRADANDRVCS